MNMFTGLQFEWRPWEKPLDKHSSVRALVWTTAPQQSERPENPLSSHLFVWK